LIRTLQDHGETYFATDHLYLAAFLVCFGHRVLGTEPQGARIAFLFDNTSHLSSNVARFMAGEAVPARRFAFEILKLKRMIPRVSAPGDQSTLKIGEQNEEKLHTWRTPGA
jgi:hypothetical protein